MPIVALHHTHAYRTRLVKMKFSIDIRWMDGDSETHTDTQISRTTLFRWSWKMNKARELYSICCICVWRPYVSHRMGTQSHWNMWLTYVTRIFSLFHLCSFACCWCTVDCVSVCFHSLGKFSMGIQVDWNEYINYDANRRFLWVHRYVHTMYVQSQNLLAWVDVYCVLLNRRIDLFICKGNHTVVNENSSLVRYYAPDTVTCQPILSHSFHWLESWCICSCIDIYCTALASQNEIELWCDCWSQR